MLLIAGSEAGSKWQSEKAYNPAKSPKELFIVEGATHTDLYDKLQYVDPNVDKMSEFFNQYLV